MAAKFTLLQTSPILKLAFRGLIFGIASLFVLSSPGSILAPLFLIAVSLLMYFMPAIRSRDFAASFIALIFIPFILPPLPVGPLFVAILLGLAFAILSGVKNLELIDRRWWYIFLNLAIFTSYAGAIIYNNFSLLSELFGFILFYFLFREFYGRISPLRAKRLSLTAAVLSLLSIELLGALTLLPFGFIAGAVLYAIAVYLIFDTYLNQLNGNFSVNMLLRNATFFTLSSLVVMALSNWTLY